MDIAELLQKFHKLEQEQPQVVRVARYTLQHSHKEIKQYDQRLFITAPIATRGEEDTPRRPPQIKATSKGRIKCCGKFRSQNNHVVHLKKHHKKKVCKEVQQSQFSPNELVEIIRRVDATI